MLNWKKKKTKNKTEIDRGKHAYQDDRFLPKHYADTSQKVETKRCSLGPCAPKFLQKCAKLPSFVLLIAAFGFLQTSFLAYTVAVLSTIQKAFNINSAQSGFLLSSFEIGYILVLPFVSHFARFSHKPRVLGVASIFAALCGILAALPYFLQKGTHNDSFTIAKNATNISVLLEQESLCHPESSNSIDICSDADDLVKPFNEKAYILFLTGMVLLGMTVAPLNPIGMSFIDGNTDSRSSSFYIAVYIAGKLAGPAIGFALGGLCTRAYVNLSSTDLKPSDPRWIGAWWLGYCLAPILFILLGIFMLCFPRQLQESEVDDDLKPEKSYKAGQCRDFFRSAGRLLSNPPYMCLVLGTCAWLYVLSGLFAFMPKYIEVQFKQPSWVANVSVGVTGPVVGILGTLVGGLLISRMRLTAVGTLMLTIVCCAITMISVATLVNLGCPQTPMAGTWQNDRLDLDETCNKNCSCGHSGFEPVCGGDGYSYFSPCHAGCSTNDKNGTVPVLKIFPRLCIQASVPPHAICLFHMLSSKL